MIIGTVIGENNRQYHIHEIQWETDHTENVGMFRYNSYDSIPRIDVSDVIRDISKKDCVKGFECHYNSYRSDMAACYRYMSVEAKESQAEKECWT